MTKEEPEIKFKKIPILTWQQIAENLDGKIPEKEAREFVPDFYTDKLHWYALRVKGDAMTSAHLLNKNFNEGNIIIVDPNKNPEHGDFVVALLPKSKEATFKQYVVDGGIKYLKPLNPQYPILQIDKGTYICGVVTACFHL